VLFGAVALKAATLMSVIHTGEIVGRTTAKYLTDDLNPRKLQQVLDEIVNGSVTRTYAYGLQRISENQLVGSSWTPRRLIHFNRRSKNTIRSQSIKAALHCFLYPKLPSVALHVVEFTFLCGFDSFRAHHLFNLTYAQSAAWVGSFEGM
jgi:hypothetical protein